MRTVGDIMQSEVVTLPPQATLRELIQVLDDGGISGVPVVDERGRLRGVVSRTDLIRVAARESEVAVADAFWETVGSEDEEGRMDPDAYFLAPDEGTVVVPGGGILAGASLGELTVEDIMTPAAFAVDRDMAVAELARFLVRGRIHRALVLEQGSLVGIVTAFDVLRAVADEAGG